MKTKVCVVGEPAVGKTSLLRRYVLDQFDDRYAPTLQARFSKKDVTLRLPEEGLDVAIEMILWDIMGEKDSRQLLQEAYFLGAQGILAVCDLTRRGTLEELREWATLITRSIGHVPWAVAGNKADLTGHYAFGEERLRLVAEALEAPYVFTSAKTGEGVDAAFARLAQGLVQAKFVRDELATRPDGVAAG